MSMAQTIRLMLGDCLLRLEELEDATVDAFVMDPPYDLTSATKGSAPKGGFMGKTWDATGIAFDPEFWKLLARKLRPSGVIKSFGGTRTYHRMVRAMRQAGLEVRQIHAWAFASGFPKSTNISKQMDRMANAKREVIGYKRGVGGENLNDIVHGKSVRSTKDKGGRGVGAYGTGAKQVAIDVPITAPATENAKLWDGYGTALKPSWECVVLARRP